nr:hypothetical protein [uncultured Roseateles sp.]
MAPIFTGTPNAWVACFSSWGRQSSMWGRIAQCNASQAAISREKTPAEATPSQRAQRAHQRRFATTEPESELVAADEDM